MWPPDPYKDQSRPVANRLRPELVKTGLVTAKYQSVAVQSGYSLRHWAPKDQTRPDFQTLLQIINKLCTKGCILSAGPLAAMLTFP